MNLKHVKDRLGYFKELYRNSLDKYEPSLTAFRRHLSQYKGSKQLDGASEAALVVRNLTYELIESQVSTLIPAPAATAKHYTELGDRLAKSIERLCVSLRDELPFETLNDMDERYTYIYGGSVWLVEWDATAAGGKGGISLKCLPPSDLIPEPGVYEIEDMEYCFLRFHATRGQVARRYGVSPDALDETGEDGNNDTVEVVVSFWRNEDGSVCRFVFSGDTLLSDEEDFYGRKSPVCRHCGKRRGLCACPSPSFALRSEEAEFPSADISLSDGRVIPAMSPLTDEYGNLLSTATVPTRLPLYRPTRFPIVIRKNTSEEKSLFGQSDCEFIRPQQQEINKIESRILMKLMRSGVTPILPDDAEMTLDNSIFGQIIKLRAGDAKDRYGVLDTTPAIHEDALQSDRLYDHAKRILGISDTFAGIADSTAISGYAKKLQIEQSAGRLESKRKMKQTAYAELDRILFEYHLAYADESLPLDFMDAFGKRHALSFHRYDFLRYHEKSGRYEYDDDFLFSVDLGSDMALRRDLLWERNLENLKNGTLGDPSSPATLLHYWQCQERAHYPNAKENVEYFRSMTEEEKGALWEA